MFVCSCYSYLISFLWNVHEVTFAKWLFYGAFSLQTSSPLSWICSQIYKWETKWLEHEGFYKILHIDVSFALLRPNEITSKKGVLNTDASPLWSWSVMSLSCVASGNNLNDDSDSIVSCGLKGKYTPDSGLTLILKAHIYKNKVWVIWNNITSSSSAIVPLFGRTTDSCGNFRVQ